MALLQPLDTGKVTKVERGHKERTRYENPEKRINGILFDTGDPTTRLIGEKTAVADGTDARERGETFYKQLWRTSDAHYFVYNGLFDPTLVDVSTAHEYMRTDWACRKFLTNEEKRELERDDEKRHEGRF